MPFIKNTRSQDSSGERESFSLSTFFSFKFLTIIHLCKKKKYGHKRFLNSMGLEAIMKLDVLM